MRLLKVVGVLVVLAGVGLLAQTQWMADSGNVPRAFSILAGRGAEIGVSIRDLRSDDRATAGVVVEDVQADSAAEKAGLKRADVVVEFDGERVRSARQFTRLVQETATGRAVKATVLRDGQKKDLQITPGEPKNTLTFSGDQLRIDGDRLQQRLNDLGSLYADRAPFDRGGNGFFFQTPNERGRLGVSIEPLTPQLRTYFGVQNGDGVLVSSVADDSPAAKAGVKTGDVITKINDEPVASADDIMRAISAAGDSGELKIYLVRDKKPTTLTAKIEPRRPARRGQPA